MTIVARFPVLLPPRADGTALRTLDVVLADVRQVLDVALAERVAVPGPWADRFVTTERAVELVLVDGQRTPPLFGMPDEIAGWLVHAREGRCPICGRTRAHVPVCHVRQVIVPRELPRGWEERR